MSRLSDIVSSKRRSGQGVVSSLSGGLKERLKEKFDPRQLINQKGLLVSLFPGLKTYQAKTDKTRTTGKSIERSSLDVSTIKPIFENILYSSSITAKNMTVLPSIHRDFNVVRQNLVKLLKLEKNDASTKADMFFKSAAKREQMYESQLSKLRSYNKKPTRLESTKTKGSIIDILALGTFLGLTGLAFKKVVDAIEKIRSIDMREALHQFTVTITNSIDDLLSSLGFDSVVFKESEIESELSKVTFSELSEDQKKKLLEKQFEVEGNKPGNLAYDLNNPGAMVFSEWQKKFGGSPGKTVKDPEGKTRTFAKFPTLEKGKEAQRHLWEKNYSEKPLSEALKKWVDPGKTEKSKKEYENYLKGIYKSLGLKSIVKNTTSERKITDMTVDGFSMKKVMGNFYTGEEMSKVENVILHHTGGNSLSSVFQEFEKEKRDGKQIYKHGSHYVIDRDGKVYNLAPDNMKMIHAATKKRDWNKDSIGIEIVSTKSENITDAQKKSTKALVEHLKKKYGKNLKIYGHGEIAPERKERSEGRALAEEIRKESNNTLKPISLGNMGENIQLSSLNMSMESMIEDTPFVVINNNNNIQENNMITQSNTAKERDVLSNLFNSIIV